MSAVEQALDFDSILATAGESAAARRIQLASAVRWVWQPFRDIRMVGPQGVEIVNSLTLRGSENVDWKATKQEQPQPITVLKRCQPYPLSNCEYEVPRHEVKRYGMNSEEIPENELPDNYSGATPRDTAATPHVVETKYAYTCARELSDKYAAEYGLVVLEPLTGVEDAEVVKQVFLLVQPKTFRLARLEAELVDAANRIRQAKVSPEIKAKAEGCRVLMLRGARVAKTFAAEHMTTFSRDIQMASAGHKGHRAFPVEYDEFVAEQLDVEVPRVVQVTKKSDRTEELLHAVAEKTLSRDDGQEDLRAMLEEERAERRRLSAQMQELMAAKTGEKEQPRKGAQS